jgi:AraC-like DNA-binding protein
LLLAVLSYGLWRVRHDRRRMQELIRQVEAMRIAALAEPTTVVDESAETETIAESASESTQDEIAAEDRLFIMRLVQVVNDNLSSGQYGVETIASEMNMSVQTFRRRLMSVTGESPKAFISAIQMELAAKLLTDSPDMSVTQIANRCGYDEVTSFGRTFRKTYGISPSQYRENH